MAGFGGATYEDFDPDDHSVFVMPEVLPKRAAMVDTCAAPHLGSKETPAMVASVLRVYDSAPGLVEALESHMDEIEGLFRGVNGFRSWTYHRTDTGGGFSLTVCDDKAGCDESVQLAANWIRENMPNASEISPPVITEATAVVRITPTERLTGGQTATV